MTDRILIFTIFCFLFACSGSNNIKKENIDRGEDLDFVIGHPEITFSAFAYVGEDNNNYINVVSDLTYGSLVYTHNNDSSRAYVEYEVQIKPLGNDSVSNVKRDRFVNEISSSGQNAWRSYEKLKIEKDYEVKPGDYEVVFTAKDLNSSKSTVRRDEVSIPDVAENDYEISGIQVYIKDNETSHGWIPSSSYHIQNSADSLRFVFQVMSGFSDNPLEITSRLLRIASDTLHADPMYYNMRGRSSIVYKGIDYDKQEPLQTTRRTLDSYENVFVEFRFPVQERGNYRFETTAVRSGSEEKYKARDFSIKSKNFPAIESAREMAAPLVYLMDEKKHRKMMSIQDSDSLRNAIDSFWLKDTKSESTARELIRLYYERVEEANKQFSNFKEGWKTDAGYIYILFGPPWYVDQLSHDLIRWSYSFSSRNPEYTYLFDKPFVKQRAYPFNHFILQRNRNYRQIEFRQIDRWRNGTILQTSI